MAADICDCGAPAGPLGLCVDYYGAILSEEQRDPEMYRWHAVVICVYLLQHPPKNAGKYSDVQFRMLQLYVDRGIDGLIRYQSHQVARNNHRAQSGYDMRPLEAYSPMPEGAPPARFAAAFSGLPYGEDGSFVFDGHDAYGNRMKTLAEATVEAWKS